MIRRIRGASATTYFAIAAFVGGVACGEGSEGSAVKPGEPAPTTATPTALATMQDLAHGIVANATHVYWARRTFQPDGGQVNELVECAKSGCNGAPTILAVDQDIGGLAIDATSVYWTNLYGTIMKIGLAGGTPTTLASGQNGAIRIAVDATNVYRVTNALYALTSSVPATSLPTAVGTVMKMPIAGGNPTMLASNLSPIGIAVDGTSVYWANGFGSNSGTLMKVPIDGGAPTTLASGLGSPTDVSVAGGYVYWTNGGKNSGADSTGTVMRTPIDGGTPLTIASQQNGSYGIAVDGTSVYWTNELGGTIVVAPLGGGASSTLATGQSAPRGIVVDATGVYWANEGTPTDGPVGSVAKLALK